MCLPTPPSWPEAWILIFNVNDLNVINILLSPYVSQVTKASTLYYQKEGGRKGGKGKRKKKKVALYFHFLYITP